MANLFITEIVDRCEFGIDLHTGSDGRTNYPQVRGELDDQRFLGDAIAFDAPLIIQSSTINGSLRKVAHQRKVDYLIYEAGEAGRLDEEAVVSGVDGCLRILERRSMIRNAPTKSDSTRITDTHWARAPRSGIFTTNLVPGQAISEGAPIGVVADAFGKDQIEVIAEKGGIVIGLTIEPLVEAGDAIAHIGTPA